MTTPHYDLIVIGAGAAGLTCGIEAARRGLNVVILDHAKHPGEKIRISGGGRCNFTNLYASADNYLSNNPKFCLSALNGYTPYDFMERLGAHRIAYEEKELGQLFCQGSAKEIVSMLLAEAQQAGVVIKLGHTVRRAYQQGHGYGVESKQGRFVTHRLVIASGGLSIPKMGATDIGLRIAQGFDLPVVTPRPALCPFLFTGKMQKRFAKLSGLSTPATLTVGKVAFTHQLLFTHRGLSGPVALQASSYWQPGQAIEIDLLPGEDAWKWLLATKQSEPKIQLSSLLARHLPKRLAQDLAGHLTLPLAELPDQRLKQLALQLNHWQVTPSGLEGYRTAEVTAGGVDTSVLSSKTMQVKTMPGLAFVGEVVDVTGQLGGFNFQWAWSSGVAAGRWI
ncbi:NAD(P)/FAD-dependent oxidoreductase [Magnetococcus sp. PR-3]|uniref:NAD(P)/FAD-dependent oxidoreductase n=1 Tax=Magnetococcus sp. PR-3 TaxID=3120355 RepID=UPI002FCDFB2F